MPVVQLADVEASLAFSALLGLVAHHAMKDPSERAFWAIAHGAGAKITFARADGPVDPAQ